MSIVGEEDDEKGSEEVDASIFEGGEMEDAVSLGKGKDEVKEEGEACEEDAWNEDPPGGNRKAMSEATDVALRGEGFEEEIEDDGDERDGGDPIEEGVGEGRSLDAVEGIEGEEEEEDTDGEARDGDEGASGTWDLVVEDMFIGVEEKPTAVGDGKGAGFVAEKVGSEAVAPFMEENGEIVGGENGEEETRSMHVSIVYREGSFLGKRFLDGRERWDGRELGGAARGCEPNDWPRGRRGRGCFERGTHRRGRSRNR